MRRHGPIRNAIARRVVYNHAIRQAGRYGPRNPQYFRRAHQLGRRMRLSRSTVAYHGRLANRPVRRMRMVLNRRFGRDIGRHINSFI